MSLESRLQRAARVAPEMINRADLAHHKLLDWIKRSMCHPLSANRTTFFDVVLERA
jgi:hypothetical protein